VNIEGGTDADVKNRINKARVIFNILGKVWSAKNISRGTGMKIFNSNVKYVLLQIPPSVSTIILSARTQSFVGLEESVTLKIVRQNPPRSE
jgi:hypothetical protein